MRPLIDFVDVADLEADREERTDGVRLKCLSQDPESGEASWYVEMDPGEPGRTIELGTLEEVFVLSGRLQSGGRELYRYSWAWSPEPLALGADPQGGPATFLAFTRSAGAGRGSGEEAVIDLPQLGWEAPRTGGFPPGGGRKTLRDHGENGAFWVLGLLPHWSSPFTESHTYLEENFLLEGEIETAVGVMTPGTYLVHPPGHVHGPMRTRSGALVITRAHGPFGNHYEHVEGYQFEEGA